MAPPPYSSFLDTSVSVPACIGRASFVFCSFLSLLQRSLSFPLDFSPLPEEDRRVLCVARYTGVRCRWDIYIYIYRVCFAFHTPIVSLSGPHPRPTDQPTLPPPPPSSSSPLPFFLSFAIGVRACLDRCCCCCCCCRCRGRCPSHGQQGEGEEKSERMSAIGHKG